MQCGCRSGGIGRRARLRTVSRKGWGFKSSLRHTITSLSYNPRYNTYVNHYRSIMNKLIFGIIGILIIGGGIYLYSSSQQPTPSIQNTKKVVTIAPGTTYTLEQIASHNNSSDCWFVVEGKVYDVTQYIADNQHPGGKDILEGCGKDATSLFNNRPEDGRPHSEDARNMLTSFYIGDLQ